MTPPEPNSSRGTILIVDDAMDMRVFISALFRTSGYSTETCRDGSTGLAKALEITPDLIILDVMMPGTGGALMYKSLKTDRRLQQIPIIMLSGVGQRSFQHYLKMLNLNMVRPLPDPDAYLEKPPEAQQLLNTAIGLMASRKG
ncbi:response regulator [Desulfosarcina sp.]|uniref:response regulator n=1 Tax=Desulfosarcina sp. TaxID=2027861 RepID=UPI0029AFD7A7|nr:response regulator [Desulfosarcina sp.]MDX2453847.1 response regulator [Desulfosarcina sp.]MDX2491547.1 response regulator [Desulfosarcina sp.]